MGTNPLLRLRQIRDDERRIAAQKPERDRLICEAAGQGYTEGQIAEAVGLSPGRINQIKLSR